MVKLYLLGSFELQIKNKVVHLPTRKMESLLAYLVLHPAVQSREKLAAIFWGDSSDELARRSLRTALSALRKELGEEAILADRETIRLKSDFHLWVDVSEMEKQAKEVLSGNPSARMDLNLYRGDLLHDFYEEWILEERDHICNLFVNAALQVAQIHRTNGEYERTIAAAQKIISIDPVNERAYQYLIFSYGMLGNRTAAIKAYEECTSQLREKLGVHPSKETDVVYEHVKNSNGSSKGSSIAKSNLPLPLTSFIGRGQELKALREIFSKTRLLTLTGVGGCGKTRLSIELAGQVSDEFAEGVWWIELASIQEETSVAKTIKRTLGLSDSQIDSTEESLIKFLRSKQTLLVLDNCEHVIHACAQLAEQLLSQCPSLKILATSREALSIPGEIAWLVPSLSMPPAGQTNDLLRWESPRLFLERATTYRSDLQLTETNTEPFLRICRALEGIPLAIEIAAARVKTLSLEQLATRLDDKLGLLTTGSRVAQPRQQTLRAAIDWSYELLARQEQVVLQRLSIFSGNWTLEAAEFVCADDKIHSSEVLDLITRLLEKSLIVSETVNEEIRYHMLEIIRQYGMEKLGQAKEVERVHDLHTRYYAELAQRAESGWYTREQSALIKQFDAHYPNLSAALAWGLSEPKRVTNWKNGVKLALALVPCWNFRAELNEGWYWLNKIIEQIDVLLMESNLESTKRIELLSVKAKAIYECGALSYYLTHHATRMDLFQASVDIYNEIGDPVGLAYPNLYVAQTASDRGQNDLARKIWRECLAHFNEIGDIWYSAMVHSFLGATERRLGNYDESESQFHQAIDLYSSVGDEWGKSIMFSHLAMIELLRGNPGKARDWFEQRLRIARQVGFKAGVSLATFQIGITHWKRGEYGLMEICIRESMPYFHQIGNFGTLADCLMGLAWIQAEAGHLEQSAFLLGAAEKLDEDFGRKVYFEYDFFNRPLHRALHSRLGNSFDEAIKTGKAANIDDVVKNILQQELSS